MQNFISDNANSRDGQTNKPDDVNASVKSRLRTVRTKFKQTGPEHDFGWNREHKIESWRKYEPKIKNGVNTAKRTWIADKKWSVWGTIQAKIIIWQKVQRNGCKTNKNGGIVRLNT